MKCVLTTILTNVFFVIIPETMEAVEEELAKGKRVHVPKLRESSPAVPPSKQEDAKAKNKKMKKTPLTSEEEDDEEDDDDDDNDGVVPQKIYEEAKKKSQHYHKLYKGYISNIWRQKKKLKEQERHINELEAENKTIRQLNIELQQQLLRKILPRLPKSNGDP
ncbi:uncharacterized protein LOC143336336 [Chaetodon auriga]|uniref:uncharacterized protein LOC143336336 n=1 Tax=Chaetodon auriga TaxID=39042 RepID=UPI004032A258